MEKFNNEIMDRDFSVRKVAINRIYTDTDEIEEIIYVSNLKYKITNIKENIINLLLKVKCGFNPSTMFEADIEFNMFVEFKNEINQDEVIQNIEEIAAPIGSEISYLLAIFTKSMGNSPLIVPPVINSHELEK